MIKVMTFIYFAYGSNLLSSRMHVQNPGAKRLGFARLNDHRLDFNFKSRRWGGYAATIVPEDKQHVWGALWEITDLASLDNQEGVHDNIYLRKKVTVFKPNNETVECQTYQLVQLPLEKNKNQPSRIYLETILQGAIETGLPADYLSTLKAIQHNGFAGPVTIPNFSISLKETTDTYLKS